MPHSAAGGKNFGTCPNLLTANQPEHQAIQMTERRERRRLELGCSVHLTRPGGDSTIHAQTKNLASGGFYCISREAFALEDAVECILAMPGRRGGNCWELRCRASVLRVDAVNSGSAFGLACRIEDYELVNRNNTRP